jgi:hypothetical protein
MKKLLLLFLLIPSLLFAGVLTTPENVQVVNTATVTTLSATTGTISTLGGAMDANNENITNIDVDSGAIDGAVIGAASPSTGAFTNVSANAIVAFTPPAVASMVTANAVTANAAIVRVQSSWAGDTDLSSNPQIPDGSPGQIVIIVGEDDTATVTLDDGNGLQTAAGASYTLGDGDTVMFYYDAEADLWREISYSNN